MAGKLGAGFSVEKVAGTVSETTLRKACGFLLMSLPSCWLRLQARAMHDSVLGPPVPVGAQSSGSRPLTPKRNAGASWNASANKKVAQCA